MITFSRCSGIVASGLALAAFVTTVSASAKSAALYSFKGGDDGAYSHAGLLRDSKGNLYGTTENGGRNNAGTVFKVTPRGSESVLYSFTGGNDGNIPFGGVIADKSGDLYGTTFVGGADSGGVVYELTAQGVESTLYTFTCGSDGCNPAGDLVADSSGNLYGTTEFGGVNAAGNIFEVTPGGRESVLYSFDCGNDGCVPFAGLTIDSSGNLYGTAGAGANGYGVVFMLATDGTFTTLYSFAGGNDGWRPKAPPVLDSSGNLYGTTAWGGGGNCVKGCGTVYELTTGGTETVLHAFGGGSDGTGLVGKLYLDGNGNAYGTTIQGGSKGCDGYGCGTVFKISPSGSRTTVHAFTGTDGANVDDTSLVADSKGYLYGTTFAAGANGFGTVFKVRE